MRELAFAKGHGARNDFVLFADPDSRIELTDAQVSALCDRRAGIGADGILRAVRTADGAWFMDYRNADGSVAEMCGNGLRVFLRFLAAEGLAHGETITVGTRAGSRTGSFLPDGRIAVTMGQVRLDADRPEVQVGARRWHGVPANVGNPHVVSIVADAAELDDLDLSRPPTVPDGRFPEGVNAEFVELLGASRVRMRVHERGSG
ncbi:MAG: diaminopimelate epimerase, partial [Propionicimonas sp.]